jgi:hypothetical protein
LKRSIRFLTLAEVKRIQAVCLTRFLGLPGIRDEASLQSAVIQPQWDHHYGENLCDDWQHLMHSISPAIILSWRAINGLRLAQPLCFLG